MTLAPPSAFGSMMPSGRAGYTASRSASVRPVSMRIDAHEQPRTDGLRLRTPAGTPARSRVPPALRSGATESSRSISSASAPLAIALSSFFGAVGGNEQERADYIRPAASHEDLALAFGHELAVLIVGAVMEFDDAGTRARFRFALADAPRSCNAPCRPRTADAETSPRSCRDWRWWCRR